MHHLPYSSPTPVTHDSCNISYSSDHLCLIRCSRSLPLPPPFPVTLPPPLPSRCPHAPLPSPLSSSSSRSTSHGPCRNPRETNSLPPPIRRATASASSPPATTSTTSIRRLYFRLHLGFLRLGDHRRRSPILPVEVRMLPPILLSCADSDSPCTPAEEGASLHIQWPTKEGTGPPDLAADGGLHQAPDPVADGGGPSWRRASHSLGHLHRRCISLPQAVSTSASVGPTHPPCQPPPSSTRSSPSSTCFPHTEDDALDLLLDELNKEPFQSSILDWDEVRRVVVLFVINTSPSQLLTLL